MSPTPDQLLRSYQIIKKLAKLLDLPVTNLIPLLELQTIQEKIIEIIDKELEK